MPTTTRSIVGSAYLIDLKQEWYNDALHFYGEALRLRKTRGDLLETLRYLRAAIIFSFASIETTINQYILDYVDRNKDQMKQDCIDKWTESNRRYVSIEEKLTAGIRLWNTSLKLKQMKEWGWFKELKRARDDLVHPKQYSRGQYDIKKLFKIAQRGIKATSRIAKAIMLSYPEVTAYPPTFDKKPTE